MQITCCDGETLVSRYKGNETGFREMSCPSLRDMWCTYVRSKQLCVTDQSWGSKMACVCKSFSSWLRELELEAEVYISSSFIHWPLVQTTAKPSPSTNLKSSIHLLDGGRSSSLYIICSLRQWPLPIHHVVPCTVLCRMVGSLQSWDSSGTE